MQVKNIFKMELYKNINDKPYLLVLGILTAMSILSTALVAYAINAEHYSSTMALFATLITVFSAIGFGAFMILYPFHLLNVDYKNRVMSLMFASGVSRGRYYFVKIAATILCNILAAIVILLVPVITFVVVNQEFLNNLLRQFIENFNSADTYSYLLLSFVGLIANTVMLTTAVIITKGKMSGIFLYFAFSMLSNIVGMLVRIPFLSSSIGISSNIFGTTNSLIGLIFSLAQIAVFSIIGLSVLKHQDL